MYKERIVKKPRKVYRCETCGEDITEEHIYTAQVWEGDFHTMREHTECATFRDDMCSHCGAYDNCSGLTTDCFYYNICDACDKSREEENPCDINYRECILSKIEGDMPI